jgi:hypothetical protein
VTPPKVRKSAGCRPPGRLARVSTDEQDTDPQLDELCAAGCATIFEEHAFGADHDRPMLTRLLRKIRPGETLAVVHGSRGGGFRVKRASSASGPAKSRHRRYGQRSIMPDATNTPPCPAAGPVAATGAERAGATTA